METISFVGVSEAEINDKFWAWQTSHSVDVIKKHPVELLPLEVKAPLYKFAPLQNSDQVSMLVEYRTRSAS
jgi:hypothetical protein